MDNLQTEEMPPQWMWPFDELVSDHLDMVREKRKNPSRALPGEEHDDPIGGTVIRNELVKGRGADS